MNNPKKNLGRGQIGEVTKIIDSKTIKVRVSAKKVIAKYGKAVIRHHTFLVEVAAKPAKLGEQVLISNVSPKSRLKKYIVAQVMNQTTKSKPIKSGSKR